MNYQIGDSLLHELIKDVIRSFYILLKSDSRFFQEVSLNVTTSQFTNAVEVDANEFTLKFGRNFVSKLRYFMVVL